MAKLDTGKDHWFWTLPISKIEYATGPFVSNYCECLDCTKQWMAVYEQGQNLICPFCESEDTERDVQPGPNYESIQ